ncbi:hypothetical protein AZ949_003402 [Escherichia coli]|nr:hypothetical protein [Escherichia coli]EFK3400512.1 hypothetical protein [Escherichia coli]
MRIGVFQRYQMKCKSVSKKSPRYNYLKNNKKQGLMQRIGRCMGYLQVAAEIEALASGADKDAIVREALLRNFNTPPFKKVPAYWLHPGLTYLKVRI